MLSWVREKLTEGRLRWQQSSQSNRNSSPSPPPLPPPHAIDSASSTPTELSDAFIDAVDNQRIESTVQIDSNRPNTSLTVQTIDSTFDSIKLNANTIRHYNHISRKDQRFDHGIIFDQSWPTNTNLSQAPTSIVVNRIAHDSTVLYVNLRIFNCIGSKCTICAPLTLTFTDIKRKVVAEFHSRRQLFLTPNLTKSDCIASNSRDRIEEQKMSCDNLDLVQLSGHYKLARISRLHEDFDEQSSLATANVQNNEEMLLVLCSTNASDYINTKDALATVSKQLTECPAAKHCHSDSEIDSDDEETDNELPTQSAIEVATKHLDASHQRGPNVVNIDELVLQSDVQNDIRKILISLAKCCAFVIGAGPYATRIITMLKQKLVQQKQQEQDTQQCLIEMGFARLKVQHALSINNNVYAAALEWLIENQTPTNPMMSDAQLQAMNLPSKLPNNSTAKDNIEALLEIIRIYCQRDLVPPPEMVQFIVAMGFDEMSAREALKLTKNHQTNACAWLVGDRSKVNQIEQCDGLASDSPILAALLNSPHVQLSFSNPKIFIAYLSILENYSSMSMWLNDSETSTIISHVLRTYHEEKHIMAINQFSQK